MRRPDFWHNGEMKAILFLTLILVTFSAHAEKILSRESFQASVRPVLNGIINDFYQMIALFPDYPKEMATVIALMDSVIETRSEIRTACPHLITENCRVPLDLLRSRLSLVEAKTLELVAHGQLPESPYLNSIIGIRLVSEFQNDLYSFKGSLDNTSFLLKARLKHKHETARILKKMDELRIMISLAVVEFVPFLYKEDFRTFYSNFIHPIEVQITKNQNYEFLNRNVNALNFSLNLLNMNLTKRNKKAPEGMAPYLSLIHNRWNSILRYYR